MAAGAGWTRPWQDDSNLNRSIPPLVAPLYSMAPNAYDRPEIAECRQDRKTLPPISNAVYGTLKGPLSPESATQQSPSQAASVLPPVPRTPAAVDPPQQFPLGHRATHDSSFLRRLSLPPLMYDYECNNLKLYREHMTNQPPREQHQQIGSHAQSKRHMSVADLPQVTALVRSASDWAVGKPSRAVRDEDAPTAAEAVHYGKHSDQLHTVVQAIVSELALLDNALEGTDSPPVWPAKAADVAEFGLHQCLDWVYRSIRRVSRWCRCQSKRDTTDTGDETPRLLNAVSTPPSLPTTKRKVERYEGDEDGTRKRACQRTCNDHFEALDRCRDYMMTNVCRKQSYMRDPPAPPLSQCFRPGDSAASLAFMSPSTSMHSSSSARVLPTPSSLSFSSCSDVLPTLSPSAEHSHSAQATHLQDLQHQISTKTLALQTLQREHDNLLSAFSRSQIRCATLEKKSQVSDNEINTLTEDRLRLMSQIESFEAQVEELVSSREEARKQSVANGGQYMKIMAMASRLEAQGAADKKKWMSEREAWDNERNDFRREIKSLQNERDKVARAGKALVTDRESTTRYPDEPSQSYGPALETTSPTHSDLLDGASSVTTDDLLKSTSLFTLRNEIVRLRKSSSAMQVALLDVRTEGERIEQAMQLMSNIKQRTATKADAGIRACGSSSRGVGEDTAIEGDGPVERSPTHGVVSHAGSP